MTRESSVGQAVQAAERLFALDLQSWDRLPVEPWGGGGVHQSGFSGGAPSPRWGPYRPVTSPGVLRSIVVPSPSWP